MMKKFLLTCLFVLMTIAAIAQDNNTIKFLGIPVEGNKKEMISKLQAKGYEYDASSDASLASLTEPMLTYPFRRLIIGYGG